ncbi:MAG: MFS transporter [Chloroflexi bacterium]|nr:MFS transporter [Chloroflexota bacterium]MCI0834046.1 MFS transporter [Chloroflexota bacterium]
MPDSTDSNTSVDSASTAESRSEVLNQVQDDNADTGVSISRPPSLALMYGLSAGHGVKHFGQGALLIMIPSIRATFGLSDIAIGGIWSAQSISSGVANIPAGILTDMFRKKVAWILFASMMMVGAGYILISISPVYWVLLVGVVIIGFGTSMWHAPAFGTLAARYPRRRGFAMAAHLTGAQIGNTTSPLIIGFLLAGTIGSWIVFGGIEWRWLAAFVSVPMILTALVVIARFKSAGAESTGPVTLGQYFASARRLVSNRGVLGMALLGAMRGAVHNSFQVFLVIYMREELGYSNTFVGVHIALITMAGIISTPIMGNVSDRIGRRPVISFAMTSMTVLLFLFLQFDSGLAMTILVAVLGLFFFSVMPIINAAAMDMIDRGSEGSGTALMFAGGSVVGSLTPIGAGFVYQSNGFHGVVIFAGTMATIGAVLALVLPMKSRLTSTA